MANASHSVKKGDTGIPLVATLSGDKSLDFNLIETVQLLMTAKNSLVLKVNAACEILAKTATTAKIKYAWQPADVNTVGEFDVEFIATLTDLSVVRFPRGVGQPFGTVIVSAAKS